MKTESYTKILNILKSVLVPAMGCTEHISVAFASAIARETIGVFPNKAILEVSSNIVKNTKSVVVPNTNGLKGLKAAFLTGLIAGDSNKGLEVSLQLVSKTFY